MILIVDFQRPELTDGERGAVIAMFMATDGYAWG